MYYVCASDNVRARSIQACPLKYPSNLIAGFVWFVAVVLWLPPIPQLRLFCRHGVLLEGSVRVFGVFRVRVWLRILWTSFGSGKCWWIFRRMDREGRRWTSGGRADRFADGIRIRWRGILFWVLVLVGLFVEFSIFRMKDSRLC